MAERVSQVAAEVLHGGAASVRVSQGAAEVLHGGAASVRVSQVVCEVLIPSSSPPVFPGTPVGAFVRRFVVGPTAGPDCATLDQARQWGAVLIVIPGV